MSGAHISSRRQQEATANISAKLGLLETWAEKGVPFLPRRPGPKRSREERKLDYFPDNETDFCTWTADDNHARTVQLYPQLLHFRSLSPATLGKNALLRERLSTALDRLKQKSNSLISKEDSQTAFEDLEADRDRWKRIAEVQEQDVRELRVKLTESERSLYEEKRARLSNESALTTKIEEMKSEIATLTATLKKLSGLRDVRR